MGDITRNLSRREFACQCGCGFDTVDFILATRVQRARDDFATKTGQNCKIIVTGGNRCKKHNSTIEGASPGSKHIFAKALDHYITFVTPKELYDYYVREYPDECGVILYYNRVHFDVRTTPYRKIKTSER